MLTCDPLINALKRLLQTMAPSGGGVPTSTGLTWGSATQAAVGAILGESATFAALYAKVRPGIKAVAPSDPAQFADPAQIAQAGRSSAGKPMIQIMPSRAATVARLAFVLAHEYAHTEHIHDRGFVTGEAAPYLTLDEYKLLRWDGELRAFQTQLVVTNEIIDSSTTPVADKTAMKAERAADLRVRALHRDELSEARRLIKADYTVSMLTTAYNELSVPDPANTYQAAVNTFKASTNWPSSAGW